VAVEDYDLALIHHHGDEALIIFDKK